MRTTTLAIPEHFPILHLFAAIHKPMYTRSRGTKLLTLWNRSTSYQRGRMRLEVCSQSYDKERFGRHPDRAGKCELIGSGGQHAGSKPYQIWAVWA